MSSESAVEVIFQEAEFLSLFQLQPAPDCRQPAQITRVMTIRIIKSDPTPHSNQLICHTTTQYSHAAS